MKGRTVIKVIANAVFAATVLGVSFSGLTPLNLAALSIGGKLGVAAAMVIVMLLINRNIDRSYNEDGTPRSRATPK